MKIVYECWKCHNLFLSNQIEEVKIVTINGGTEGRICRKCLSHKEEKQIDVKKAKIKGGKIVIE